MKKYKESHSKLTSRKRVFLALLAFALTLGMSPMVIHASDGTEDTLTTVQDKAELSAAADDQLAAADDQLAEVDDQLAAVDGDSVGDPRAAVGDNQVDASSDDNQVDAGSDDNQLTDTKISDDLLTVATEIGDGLLAVDSDDHPADSDSDDLTVADDSLADSSPLPLAENPLFDITGYDAVYYVSADGDDSGSGDQNDPWATLAMTASIISGSGEVGKNYLVVVMTDLISSASARYYGNNVTITSFDTRVTVTRAEGFSTLNDVARGWYHPAMLEIGNGGEYLHNLPISLTLKNIVFDDAGLRPEGTNYGWAPAPGHGTGLDYEQDAIVATYDATSTIILGSGAQLLNFGGMTAIRATPGNVVLKAGSLISDTTVTSRLDGRATYTTRSDSAIHISGMNAEKYARMTVEDGAFITNIVDATGISIKGHTAMRMDGQISGFKGGATNDDGNNGRGSKNAINISATTYDPINGGVGPALIGPSALIIDNESKSGTVQIRAGSLSVYGKINNNTCLSGITKLGNITLKAGTNGGGLFIISSATVFLEEGSEVCGNKTIDGGYGGAASVQQGTAKLVMNGGLISGNSATSKPGIAVNKGDAGFEMNGGKIDNGKDAVYLAQDSSITTTGILTFNSGWVSGIMVQNTNVFGHSTRAHLVIKDAVHIEQGFAYVAGRSVTPLTADFSIGNPNTANYTTIREALPTGWKLPTTAGNVVAFWMSKAGTANVSVPIPLTGTNSSGYDKNIDRFCLAVVAVQADGTVAEDTPVKFYATEIVDNQIVVAVPLEDYPFGATVALAQPYQANGQLEIEGPETLYYHLGDEDYRIDYTASYTMPEGFHSLLITDGFNLDNTVVELILQPTSPLYFDVVDMSLDSKLFEIVGTPIWLDGKLNVSLQLKEGWEELVDGELDSVFSFTANLTADDFLEGDDLRMTGQLVINGGPEATQYSYLAMSNLARTWMQLPWLEVIFDANGGELADDDTSRLVKINQTVGSDMPADPVLEGYSFLGWNSEPDGTGWYFDSDTVVLEDTIVFAIWLADEPETGTGEETETGTGEETETGTGEETETGTGEEPEPEPGTEEEKETDPEPEPGTEEETKPEPKPGAGSESEVGNISIPKTGDSAIFWLDIVVVSMAIGAICVILHLRKKQHRES
ncbi:MAG: InlB B-repeat-containing protein [Coriobacteriales bacterium]|nr:InlB B-repeat-containing protein [Coriobacteriales bacterium]